MLLKESSGYEQISKPILAKPKKGLANIRKATLQVNKQKSLNKQIKQKNYSLFL